MSARGVVVIGATSAIARAGAQEFAAGGCAVIVAARDQDENEAIAADLRVRYGVEGHAFAWDAEAFDTHGAFVARCIETLGDRLDGVVLCSGYMAEQKAAQGDWSLARRMIDVNYSASVSVIERFAAHFEVRRSGFLCVVSSVAGDRGRQSNYLYGSTKAALSIWCEGLRNRLYPAGVHVVTVKPGFVDTKMTWGTVPFAASPEAAAKAILKAIDKKKNVVYVPWFWRYIMLIIRHVPEWQFKKMKM